MSTAHPVALGGLQVTDPVQLGPYLTAGNPASVGARRLRDMPEVWAAGEGTYALTVAEDGSVLLVPTTALPGASYHHVQLAASDTWTIVHGLGFRPAGIVIKDSAGDRVIPGDVDYPDPDTVLVTVGRAMSGTAEVS